MALQDDDMIQINAEQNYLGKDILNVLYYRVINVAGTVTLTEALEEWDDQITSFWTDIMNENWILRNLVSKELKRGIDIATLVLNAAGQDPATTSQRVAAFVACQIKFPRSFGNIRSGFMRLAGLAEDVCESGSINATFQNALQLLGDKLCSTLNVVGASGSCDLIPVTLGRKKVDGKYELDFTRYDPRGSAVAMPNLTTQNTRKD